MNTLNQKIDALNKTLALCNFVKEIQTNAMNKLALEKEWLTVIRTTRIIGEIEQHLLDDDFEEVEEIISCFKAKMSDMFLSTLANEILFHCGIANSWDV